MDPLAEASRNAVGLTSSESQQRADAATEDQARHRQVDLFLDDGPVVKVYYRLARGTFTGDYISEGFEVIETELTWEEREPQERRKPQARRLAGGGMAHEMLFLQRIRDGVAGQRNKATSQVNITKKNQKGEEETCSIWPLPFGMGEDVLEVRWLMHGRLFCLLPL